VILAGDIGGTNTRLALFAEPSVPLALEIYPSREHASLEEMVRTFLAEHPVQVDAACFDVAGPVRNGSVDPTNLAWPVDGAVLARLLGLPSVALLNDLEANAWGLPALGPEDVAVLNEGDPKAVGNAAVCSAGTGLGEAGLYWDGARHRPLACECGHTDFGPRNDLELDLYRFLAAEHGHVSYERVCSGPGLVNIYRFLVDRSGEPASVELEGAAISRAALEGSDECAAQAQALMISIYGAEAGNLALKVMATGGVYLGGGIPPRILPLIQEEGFMRSFIDKGRFHELLSRIPVRVILNDKTALLGSALRAAEELGQGASRSAHAKDDQEAEGARGAI
jgi:glucokinase